MAESAVCKQCGRGCEIPCGALNKLIEIYKQTREQERHQLIRKLNKDLDLIDAEPSKELKKLAEQVIYKFSELQHIIDYQIKIGYVISQENPPGSKIKYADCTKLKLKYKAWLPYDFIVTFYAPNTDMLSDNQRKILMLHELRHIGVGEKGLKLMVHEVEDFTSILQRHGITWNGINEEVIDILDENTEMKLGEDDGR